MFATLAASLCFLLAQYAAPQASRAQDSFANPQNTWSVTIVLPPRVVAGEPATLAVFGVDGRLAPNVKIDLAVSGTNERQQLTTDETGRASFTAPSSGHVLIARGSGASTAALIDQPPAVVPKPSLVIAPVISLRNPFSICSSGLRGSADANRVKINGEPSLVIAASPACIVAVPGAKMQPGPAKITMVLTGTDVAADTALISLDFDAPNPPLLPDQKGKLTVRVYGSASPVRMVVTDKTPGILRFLRGDRQEVVSSGGPANFAALAVQGVSSGDYSFDATVLPAADPHAALEYLRAAENLAPGGQQRDVAKLANRLASHPHDAPQLRAPLESLISRTIEGDLRTLLQAALSVM